MEELDDEGTGYNSLKSIILEGSLKGIRHRNRNSRQDKKQDTQFFSGALSAYDQTKRVFLDLILNEDADNRPIYTAPDGHIFLETFNRFYSQAYDFIVSIAEPVTRPKKVQEYQITTYSMYCAVSLGLSSSEIIRVLKILSKSNISPTLIDQIKATCSTVGKIKLVLLNNRYFIESTDLNILKELLRDDIFSSARLPPQPNDRVETTTNFVIPDPSEFSFAQEVAGITQLDTRTTAEAILEDFDITINQEESFEKMRKNIRRFEINQQNLEDIRKRALEIQLPLIDEYMYHYDFVTPNLNITLSNFVTIRPYQEKALSKIFANGRARSGIVVLPCGAGKTLVGIATICTLRKSAIILCNSSLSALQWKDQISRFTTPAQMIGFNNNTNSGRKFYGNVKVCMLTSKTKDKIPDDPKEGCILISTYQMLSHSGQRAEETQKILDSIQSREWGITILDEVQEFPARTFRRLTMSTLSHCTLGLTATLIREDGKIEDLNYLIGPKLYEANWIDLLKVFLQKLNVLKFGVIWNQIFIIHILIH